MENRGYLGSITKYNIIGFGSNADVYLAEYFGSSVAYKEFWKPEYAAAIKDEIVKLSEFKGYTMPLLYKYNFVYEEYLEKLDYDKKISILFKARDLLEELHKEYRILHADVAPWNFMYNEDSDHLVLTDYDTSLSISNSIKINGSHNDIVREYAKYNKIDEHLDVFLFNLCCYAVLNNLDINFVLGQIRNNNFGILQSKKAINVLSSYKDLSDTKSLKKEYIIDYLK